MAPALARGKEPSYRTKTSKKCFGYPTKAVWLATVAAAAVLPQENREVSVAAAASCLFFCSETNTGVRKANVHRPRVDFKLFADSLNEREFRRRFRVDKMLFELILGRIERDLRKDEAQAKKSSGSSITPAWRLAITLRMLAGGDPCGCADMAHVSDKTVWPVVYETVDAINRHFPVQDFDVMDAAKLKQLESEFAMRSENVVRGCVGAIDGTAVCIRKPLSSECGGKPWHYYNRKGFYALNLQAVCDSKKRFLYYSIKCTGNTHDSTAFDVSSLGAKLAQNRMRKPYWIAGDNAYRASEFMVVPWPGRNLDTAKDSFNFWHSNSRITIEGAFGILTQRWGIFWRPIPCSIKLATKIVVACMTLHNLCMDDRIARHRVEYVRGDCGRLSEHVPHLETGGALWADQSESRRGRRTDLDTCPHRQVATDALEAAGMTRPARSNFRY